MRGATLARMTDTAVVYSHETDSARAGKDLGDQIAEKLGDPKPGAVIVFASSKHDYHALLKALSAACSPTVMVGSSSAGEFTSNERGEERACALAIRSKDMQFAVGVGRGVTGRPREAAAQLVKSLRGRTDHGFPYRSALLMTDALAGHAHDLVEELTVLTSGMYQFFGGGAGDDAQFKRTHVFFGTEAASDAIVALEILSTKPLGVGVAHGWAPASDTLRVTASEGMRVLSLNGMPAIEALEEHARVTGQQLDRAAPLPFFLHNILGIATEAGFQLRVPLSIGDDGSIACAAEIPVGARVHIMKTTSESAIAAAANATKAALTALGGAKPRAALFFDCVATRLRMGDAFGFELETVSELLGGAEIVGCNTYGQIARAEGQFGGFHNCTAVVCVFPE